MIDALNQTFTLTGLLWLCVSLISYVIALGVNKKCNGHPVAHPIIITALLVSVGLSLTNTSVVEYQRSASLLHWLLGPITVALALPIYRQWQKLKYYGWRLIVSIVFGGIIAPVTAWFSLYILDAPTAINMTMLAKSITTPLAMEASAQIGGVPALAAVFVITTGIVGAIVAAGMFSVFNVTDRQAQGIALGTVAHAVGTAKAIHMGEEVAAMATLGLCVNGIFTALAIPVVFGIFV
ncbi:LrgB family protein [Alteromonas sp. ALT199]|uniref:LrgB family protein n=1 Tax=unclassified Alteromonas TaxID=2614992 RepID=UPI001BEB29E1|nr:LrgB family protein [Alteromonas sp. ALT199]MBT3134769.1 LrgB family protein [Alteromonas sp. ALT199]